MAARTARAPESILSPLLAAGGVRMVAAAGGVGTAWPAVSKAPREVHVAPQVSFLASGDEEPPRPQAAAPNPQLSSERAAPAMGTRGPGGTRGARGTGTSSRGLRGCSEEGRILHLGRQRASWSAGEARETLPFPHGGNIRASPTAGCRSGIFLGVREAPGGLPSWPRSAPRARACCVSGFEDGDGGPGTVRAERGGVRPGRALTACPSRSGSRTCTGTA